MHMLRRSGLPWPLAAHGSSTPTAPLPASFIEPHANELNSALCCSEMLGQMSLDGACGGRLVCHQSTAACPWLFVFSRWLFSLSGS